MQQHSFVKFVPNVDLVYLSIPKVASSSISYALLTQACGSSENIGEHSELGKALTNRRPVTLAYPELPMFTFVRHPIRKFLSYYNNKFVQARASGFELVHLIKLGFDPHMTIDEMVDYMLGIRVEEMEHHAQPQFRILCNHGKLIADYVGKVESFDTEWPILATLSGCNLQIKRQRNVSSTDVEQITTVSAETLAKLYRYYQTDFSLFEYDYDGIVSSAYAVPKAEDDLSDEAIQTLKQEIKQRKNRAIELANSLNCREKLEAYKQLMRQKWYEFIVKEYRLTLANA